MDTLFLTRGENGVDEGSEDAKTEMGITIKDEKTKDIEFVIVNNRTTREAKGALIHYGGGLGKLKKCVADKAPEFQKALVELNIAYADATPGRSTSHGAGKPPSPREWQDSSETKWPLD